LSFEAALHSGQIYFAKQTVTKFDVFGLLEIDLLAEIFEKCYK